MSGGNPDDTLPSYEDVLKEQNQYDKPPARPARPQGQSIKPAKPNPGYSFHDNSISSHLSPNSAASGNPARNLPWVYPVNYYCEKCRNTGFKLKNGRSCKTCWRRFSPSNNILPVVHPGYVNSYYQQPYQSMPIGQPMQNRAPVMVAPGDSRLGGVLCGECRGSGRIRFLLDTDLCPLCNGVGRIIPYGTNTHVTF